jgi:phosphoribosyl-AMP cyclohydrolase / phosphoribosyl-ATP pyrophosphohydrolase
MSSLTPRSTIAFDPARVAYGPADGLVPGVVQDRADGRVLMVAYLDAEALAATLETGQVHFHSRSRGALWRKGETSGNVLELRSIALDCDEDALLLTVDPTGPTCHRGVRSCFDPAEGDRPGRANGADSGRADRTADESRLVADQGFAWLETLWATIVARVEGRPADSYTAQLLDGGVDAVGRKVTEEATEVLIAAKDDATVAETGGDRDRTQAALAGEAADLLYHSLVLLAERGLAPRSVIDALRARHTA